MTSMKHVLFCCSKQINFIKSVASSSVYLERRLYSRGHIRLPIEVLSAHESEVLHSGKKFKVVNRSEPHRRTKESPSQFSELRKEQSKEVVESQARSYGQSRAEKSTFGSTSQPSINHQPKPNKPDDKESKGESKNQAHVPKRSLSLAEGEKKLNSLLVDVKSKKSREKQQKILLEGRRLVADAIHAGVKAEAVFYSREDNLENIPLHGVEIVKVPYKQLELWSDLKTSPGVLGIFHLPSSSHLKLAKPTIPLTIICDNVREPGNLGAILRNAAAVGASSVVLMKGCTDPWDSKVLRAGAGAHFRINVISNLEWSLINNYVPEESVVYLADIDANPPKEMDARTARILEKAEMLRTSETEIIANQELVLDSSFDNLDAVEVYKKIPMPVKQYSQTLFAKYGPVTLVIGGETHSLSGSAYKLGHERNGVKLKIPLECQVDSLNSGVAMGILAYEIRRQLLLTCPEKA